MRNLTGIEDPARRASIPGRIHIRHWGFGHPVYLPQIVAVEAPKIERTYRDAPSRTDPRPPRGPRPHPAGAAAVPARSARLPITIAHPG